MIDLYTRKLRQALNKDDDCTVERVKQPFIDRIVMYDHAHRVIADSIVSTRLAMLDGTIVYVTHAGDDHYHAFIVHNSGGVNNSGGVSLMCDEDSTCLTYDRMIYGCNKVAIACM